MTQQFAGDKKVGKSLLYDVEHKLIDAFVAKIPPWLETYHLTLLTIPWSLLIILFSYLARQEIAWLWGCSLVIILQYVTDLFDGAVGRLRKTGLIKWGFYMDHFLDYIFLCSTLTGYSFLVDDHFKYLLFFTLTVVGAYMVHSYLSFAVTNEFRISYLKIGPTEVRLLFIVINTLLVIFGKTYLGGTLPFILAFSLVGLCVVVYYDQRRIWMLDIETKKLIEIEAQKNFKNLVASSIKDTFKFFYKKTFRRPK
jgi:phosphatidylglycerophosphate synthase